jgi:hypothetical protein
MQRLGEQEMGMVVGTMKAMVHDGSATAAEDVRGLVDIIGPADVNRPVRRASITAGVRDEGLPRRGLWEAGTVHGPASAGSRLRVVGVCWSRHGPRRPGGGERAGVRQQYAVGHGAGATARR